MEAILDERTLAELAAKGIHHMMIGSWSRRAMGGMNSLFDGGDLTAKGCQRGGIEKLQALTAANANFVSKAGLWFRSSHLLISTAVVRPYWPSLGRTCAYRLVQFC
jgi:hypothetical protein